MLFLPHDHSTGSDGVGGGAEMVMLSEWIGDEFNQFDWKHQTKRKSSCEHV